MFQQSKIERSEWKQFRSRMFQDRKIRHLIKFTALNYAKEEEWRQARGVGRMEREAMIYTRLFMFLVLSSSRKCAQSYAYRYSIIGSDRRFSPSDPSVLRNNVVPLLLFPLTYFLLSAFSLLLFHGVQFLLACARCARIRGQERIEMSVFD